MRMASGCFVLYCGVNCKGQFPFPRFEIKEYYVVETLGRLCDANLYIHDGDDSSTGCVRFSSRGRACRVANVYEFVDQ